ncbi:unnamed protein product [Coffea canephora]|uniref:DH200=94 genomic scaffold, scaffold_1059 n=1 Tax=Coffea canephora TaxID=49390 RepID=A0A068VKR7_COFCA|nr:unnamed protein product [Coffea canephora]
MCRLIICVDGTHLRGEYKGKLLVAVTQDANNKILSIAYAIEPLDYHRFCLRHVRSNLITHFNGLHLKNWSSECLATLYRSLCDAANPAKSAIAGPLVLLQIWIWEHIPTIRPDRIAPLEHYPGSYFIKYRWNNDLDVHRVVRHVMPAFRDQLTGLRSQEFIWQPYSEDVLASLSAYCTAGRDIWRSVTCLICWDVVEPYLPHRVMRQFVFHQSLPDMWLTDNHDSLHSLDRRGRANQDWNITHRQYIDIWTDRRVHVQDGIVIEDTKYPSDEYVQWYQERTVIYISNSS